MRKFIIWSQDNPQVIMYLSIYQVYENKSNYSPLCNNYDIYNIDMKEFNAMSVKLVYVSIMFWTSFLSILNPILFPYLIMRILSITDTASVTHWLKIAINPQIFIDNASTCQLICKLMKMYLVDLLNWRKRNKYCISSIIYTQGCPKSANCCFEKKKC